MAHGIMHRLAGNMKIFRNLSQREILIVIQVQAFTLPWRQELAVTIKELAVLNYISKDIASP